MNLKLSVLFFKFVVGIDIFDQGVDNQSQSDIGPEEPLVSYLNSACRTLLFTMKNP
jgi:hypothetical protein